MSHVKHISRRCTYAPHNCQCRNLGNSLCISSKASSSFAIPSLRKLVTARLEEIPRYELCEYGNRSWIPWKNISSAARRKTFSRDNALVKSSRCHRSRRIRSKVSIQWLYPGKVGNRKVWQSEESRKTLSETRGAARARRRRTPPAPEYVYSDPWKNTRDIPQGRNELTTRSSESSCCRCRCNFKGVCLSGRVAVTRARRNVREIFIPHSFLKNIIAIVSSRTSLHISRRRDIEVRNFPLQKLCWQRETRLSEAKRNEADCIIAVSLSHLCLRSVMEVCGVEKSATEKQLVMERLETPNFIENFAGCLCREYCALRDCWSRIGTYTTAGNQFETRHRASKKVFTSLTCVPWNSKVWQSCIFKKAIS